MKDTTGVWSTEMIRLRSAVMIRLVEIVKIFYESTENCVKVEREDSKLSVVWAVLK